MRSELDALNAPFATECKSLLLVAGALSKRHHCLITRNGDIVAQQRKRISGAYSAELKLSAVLEYVRDPKRKELICQEKGISELLLEQWYQEFVQRAGRVFPSSELPVAPRRKRRKSHPVEDRGRDDSSPWGIRLNSERACYRSRSTSANHPQSLGGVHPGEWNERGLIIWDRSAQKMELFPASRALKILETLRTHQEWRTEGLRIIQPWLVYDHQADGTENVAPTPRRVQEELFHLPLAASEELAEFLQGHEAFLKEMVAEDERDWEKRQEQAFSILFQARRRVEANDVDLNSRALRWCRYPELVTLVCDDPPNRGTVTLTEDGWFWQAWIERPGKMKQRNRPLLWIEEALQWIEQELHTARTQQEIRRVSSRTASDTGTVGPESQIDLTPFRIQPTDLEPREGTYRPIIELDHVPTSFETVELSFGETGRTDERYPSPSKLARELDFDSSKVRIEQLGGRYGFYEISPVATSGQKDAAVAQAQDLWNASAVAEMFKAGKVERACFGFEEIETGFCTWLGNLEHPENLWPKPESRTGYLTDLAQRETLIHALDVQGYRKYTHAPLTAFSDGQLLVLLHEWRAISKYIPERAREESRIWLAQHNKALR